MTPETAPLLQPSKLVSRAEFMSQACPVPQGWGVYGWYFNEIPLGLESDWHRAHDHALLYVGIAPKSVGAKPKRGLRSRLQEHFARNAEASTLRYSLGCLLSEQLSLELRLVGSKDGRKVFINGGEGRLDDWLDEHARIAWIETLVPWEVEADLLRSGLMLPFNIDKHMGPNSLVARTRALHLARAREYGVGPRDSGRGDRLTRRSKAGSGAIEGSRCT